ncbi:HNH endonuclease signature motif containing protein [Tomitella biformata]|uniref:HNH endonuclease signature motif containing protein n=1 Tax=Tomitella biformata TaxID=630403 RepID=UPI000464FCF0|nr:HNH endonuclease signature motif containing protein [Tomitella biformata]
MSHQWQLDGLSAAELLDLAHASVKELATRQFDHLDNLTRLDVVEGFERISRTIPGISHELINQLGQQNAATELGATHLYIVLSKRLHITTADAKRRIASAVLLGPGVGIGGQPIHGEHAPTGDAQRDGDINTEHADVILKFFKRLPTDIPAEEKGKAEKQLVDLAKQTDPDEVDAAARQIEAHLNPDGDLPDEEERKGKTYFRMGRQGRDKLTRGSFCIDAETRSYVEAYLAKAGQPGVGNPDDEHPIFDAADLGTGDDRADRAAPTTGGPGAGGGSGAGGRGCPSDPTPAQQDLFDYFAEAAAAAEPSEQPRPAEPSPSPDEPADSPEPSTPTPDATESDAADAPHDADAADTADSSAAASRDRRSQGQIYHDALKRLFRWALGAPGLGQHNGLPVTAIITMTLEQLETATGNAMTGGGTMIPIREAIRMASHSHHYLVIYDGEGRPLHLGRSKRLASADQRIVLYAGDRGCTHPGCTRPGYSCQVHHTDEWAENGNTDIELLAFACPEHHGLVGPGEHDWATTIAPPTSRYPFRTVWHPPACIDPERRGRVNHYLFPEEYLEPQEEFPGPPGYIPKARRVPGGQEPPPTASPQPPPKRE